MRPDPRARRAWVRRLADAIQDTVRGAGLERVSWDAFACKANPWVRRYILGVSFPRRAADQHVMYINPCLGTYIFGVEELASRLRPPTGRPLRKLYTVGGSLGLLKGPNASMEDWPVDDEASTLALAEQLRGDIRAYAVEFWDVFTSAESMVRVVELEHRWHRQIHMKSWEWIAAMCLVKGIEPTIDYIRAHRKWYWYMSAAEAVERLRDDSEWRDRLPRAGTA